MYSSQQLVIKTDSTGHQLVRVVQQLSEDFMLQKGKIPDRIFLNDKDFDLPNEIEVCDCKVRATHLVPQGKVIVTDNTVKTIFD